MMPSFFISHGSPLLAIENNSYTRFLSNLGTEIPRPKAVVLFSAHWVSRMQQVSEASAYGSSMPSASHWSGCASKVSS